MAVHVGCVPLTCTYRVRDALGPAQHFLRGAAREGQQQDPLGRHALEQQMRDPMRERIGLAGSRARDDEQRPGREAGTARPAVRGSVILGGIQALAEGSAGASWTCAFMGARMMAQGCIKRQKYECGASRVGLKPDLRRTTECER